MLNKEDTVNYLNNAIRLESDIYIQTNLIKEFNNSIKEQSPSLKAKELLPLPTCAQAGYKKFQASAFRLVWACLLLSASVILAIVSEIKSVLWIICLIVGIMPTIIALIFNHHNNRKAIQLYKMNIQQTNEANQKINSENVDLLNEYKANLTAYCTSKDNALEFMNKNLGQ